MVFADTRYNRQEMMPQVGAEGQRRLGLGSAVSIGAGGVKSSLLYHLVAAGLGRLRIIDFDWVEMSNLNRQILYETADIGRNKAEAARARLEALNDEIVIEAVDERVEAANIDALCDGFDVVIEGGDSLDGRLLVNERCLRSGQPMVHASAQYAYGYVLTVIPSRTACFRCAFPDLPAGHGGSVPVLGVATGIAGSLGAGEVVKVVSGVGTPVIDGYLAFSVFQSRFDFVDTPRDPHCAACGDGHEQAPLAMPEDARAVRRSSARK